LRIPSFILMVFFFFTLLTLTLLSIPIGKSTPLSVSNIYIEPTGYEDPSTNEWKGSFWIISAVTNTKESYLFHQFNETESGLYGQNKIGNKTIVPTATIKITITPGQPYWEIPLQAKTYMVYPETYGTWINKITKDCGKIVEEKVPALYVTVLESTGSWKQHTPFDVKVEKIGDKQFTNITHIDTFGGTVDIVIRNPADMAEKLIITSLGQLSTGYDAPPFNVITVFNKTGEYIPFDGEYVRKAIEYGRNTTSGVAIFDYSYAFYWFGGGSIFTSKDGKPVQCWDDTYKSPAHYVWRHLPTGDYKSPAEELDNNPFSGLYRADDFWNYRIIPLPASVFDDNPNTTPYGYSLVNYIKQYVSREIDLDLDWNQGWEIIASNLTLRVKLPKGATSSLITIKISAELADSVVYQPIVANGKVEQAFWDSTKTTKGVIKDKDVAVLKVKQYASQSAKITVTPTVPTNIPILISPQMDSAIVDPNAMHTFQFEIRNLGTQNNQSSTITFTVTNDLGNVTDTVSLDFDLIVTQGNQQNPPPNNTTGEGDPLWMWLVAVISITIATASIYTIYTYRSTQKQKIIKSAKK